MGVSKEVYDEGQQLALASSSTIADELNRVLNRFLKWPLKAATGYATDPDGQGTDRFGTIIYTTSPTSPETGEVHVPADSLTCVIDVNERIDLEIFRESYQRVARAKRLRKAPPLSLGGPPYITATLGIIFAIQNQMFRPRISRLSITACSESPHISVPSRSRMHQIEGGRHPTYNSLRLNTLHIPKSPVPAHQQG
jgi:hypothetical protein